ncbi:MAG: TetR/AcrR family transcriptional regulator [Lachnospiraceae bacterium]|jgi:AcrR family transcriptional regulator|nr:TetR/AcrR family transcriptional regulator [Lachnospiraceae bacterium]
MAAFTKKAIIDNFLILLDEKPFNEITVKEIVEKCGINRKTFYYYFHNTYELADEMFREKIDERRKEFTGDQTIFEEFLAVYDFLKQNRKATRHAYHSISARALEDYTYKLSHERMAQYVTEQAEGCRCTPEMIHGVTDCYTAALTGLSLRWVGSDMPDDFQENIRSIFRSIDGLTKAILSYHI